MQPYFFPYIGYFELIARSDRWIVFDVVQYNPKTWMNRNRVLHPDNGWQYINLPVQKSPHGSPISSIRVFDKTAALARLLGQLMHYRKHAPYYLQVIDLVRRGFENTGSERLVDVNVSALSVICDYLGIGFDWSLCSEMGLDLDAVDAAGDWALQISRQLGAAGYINPPGGRDLFNPADWRQSGIDLHILEPANHVYTCLPYRHEANLSIIDVLMWNDPVSVIAAMKLDKGLYDHHD